MNIDKLLEYNTEGFIPGPSESMEAFEQRVSYCLNLPSNPDLPLPKETEGPKELIESAYPSSTTLFDIKPHWIPIFFSNYQLMPWHAGCAWIFQVSDQTPTAAFFQLRSHFKIHPSYLGIYQRDEIFAHEIAHVGRMMFEEPKYEEILAYQTSKNKWRQYIGPLFQSGGETALFVFLLLPLVLWDTYLLTMGYDTLYKATWWTKLIPVALLSLYFIRLWMRQTTFKKTLRRLGKAVGYENAHAVIYRLTDQEIEIFSKITADEIRRYAERQRDKSLRWQVIAAAYFC